MICTFVLLVLATVALLTRPRVAFALLFLYLVGTIIVWYHFEIPTVAAFVHDRILDLILVPAFYGANRKLNSHQRRFISA